MTGVALVIIAVTAAVGLGFVIGRSTAPGGATTAASSAMLRDELREAPNRDQFVLHYQPKIELSTGRVTSLEALVRWQHPRWGLLTPSEFLPLAGQNGELMASLTGWVLRRALTDHIAWTMAGLDWTVAVNVFAENLESLEFADTVGQILAEAGVDPGRLRLEVTQSEFGVDPGRVAPVVYALATQGVSVAIDDFRIGGKSVSLLHALQVAEIKIDPTLIAALPGHERDRARVRSLIDVGHSLGCSVTAEGVESPDVAAWLTSAACDQAQGYLWLRPRAWDEITQVFGHARQSQLKGC